MSNSSKNPYRPERPKLLAIFRWSSPNDVSVDYAVWAWALPEREGLLTGAFAIFVHHLGRDVAHITKGRHVTRTAIRAARATRSARAVYAVWAHARTTRGTDVARDRRGDHFLSNLCVGLLRLRPGEADCEAGRDGDDGNKGT